MARDIEIPHFGLWPLRYLQIAHTQYRGKRRQGLSFGCKHTHTQCKRTCVRWILFMTFLWHQFEKLNAIPMKRAWTAHRITRSGMLCALNCLHRIHIKYRYVHRNTHTHQHTISHNFPISIYKFPTRVFFLSFYFVWTNGTRSITMPYQYNCSIWLQPLLNLYTFECVPSNKLFSPVRPRPMENTCGES